MLALLVPFGSHGDVLPLIGLGQQLLQRGFAVKMLLSPAFASAVQQAGLDWTPLGQLSDYESVVHNRATASRFRSLPAVAAVLGRYLQLTSQAIEAEIRPRQTLLIGSSLAFPTRCLAEKHHLPCLTVHLQPSIIRSSLRPPTLGAGRIPDWMPRSWVRFLWWLMDQLMLDPAFARPLNQLRRELGLPQVHSVLGDWLHRADGVLGLFPAWFAQPPADWPAQLQLTNFPLWDGGGEEVDLSDTVVFTAGTALACVPEFYRKAVQSCARLGCRGLLLTPHPSNLPDPLPSGVRWHSYLPFGSNLRSAAAIVHHGGIGTTSQALRAGIPQIIWPLANDQFDNAHRLHSLGLHPPGLREALQDSLWRQRARHFSEQQDWTSGLVQAADLIARRWLIKA